MTNDIVIINSSETNSMYNQCNYTSNEPMFYSSSQTEQLKTNNTSIYTNNQFDFNLKQQLNGYNQNGKINRITFDYYDRVSNLILKPFN